MVLGIASAEIKSKLEDFLALLQQDITQLVDDSDPAKIIFKTLRGQIPTDAEETLFQASHQRVANFSTRRSSSALSIEPPMPNLKR